MRDYIFTKYTMLKYDRVIATSVLLQRRKDEEEAQRKEQEEQQVNENHEGDEEVGIECINMSNHIITRHYVSSSM